ncbi:MAG: hypothetical protein ACI4B6_01545 [Atopobiaceae bacterium]
MLNAQRIVTFGLVLTLMASPVVLAGCGSSSSDTNSSTTSASTASTASDESAEATAAESSTDQEATASDSSSSDGAQSYSIQTSEITEAYMGVAESGETVYYVGNSDGSKTGIFFLDADKMAHVSFMGPASVTQQDGESLITITDELSGNTLTFGVTGNDDGTVTIDMGSELGKAVLAPCEVSEAVTAIQTIQGNTTQVG